MGRQIGEMIRNVSQFMFSVVAAFYLNWQLTLVLLSAFPIIGGAGLFMMNAMKAAQNDMGDQYASAGRLAKEMLSGVRTVTALNAQVGL